MLRSVQSQFISLHHDLLRSISFNISKSLSHVTPFVYLVLYIEWTFRLGLFRFHSNIISNWHSFSYTSQVDFYGSIWPVSEACWWNLSEIDGWRVRRGIVQWSNRQQSSYRKTCDVRVIILWIVDTSSTDDHSLQKYCSIHSCRPPHAMHP